MPPLYHTFLRCAVYFLFETKEICTAGHTRHVPDTGRADEAGRRLSVQAENRPVFFRRPAEKEEFLCGMSWTAIALLLIIIGGINWGLVGLFQFDLVAWIFGGSTAIGARVLYVLIANWGALEPAGPVRAAAGTGRRALRNVTHPPLSGKHEGRFCRTGGGADLLSKHTKKRRQQPLPSLFSMKRTCFTQARRTSRRCKH